MSEPITDRLLWIKARMGDELGLSEEDIAALYKVTPTQLDAQFTGSPLAPDAIVAQILADIESAVSANRKVSVSDVQLKTIQSMIARYPIRKLVPLEAVLGAAWRLTADDSQWVAYRLADVIGLDYESSDAVRQRLNRLALSYSAIQPAWDDTLRDQITRAAVHLCELSGVV